MALFAAPLFYIPFLIHYGWRGTAVGSLIPVRVTPAFLIHYGWRGTSSRRAVAD